MTVLRFRVIFEDDDSVFRDIEIKPSQTFTDFEKAIVSAYNLPVNEGGNFYFSNDNWQKGKLLYPLPEQPAKKGKGKDRVHVNPMLVLFIDDPHQHFVFEYRGSREFIFLIELSSLNGVEQPATEYPLMVRSQGPSPFKREEIISNYAKQKAAAVNTEAEEDEEEDDDEPPFMTNDSQADEEELSELGEDEGAKGDLMEGDKIEEEVEEDTDTIDVDGGDDFDPEEMGETTKDDEFGDDDR